MKPKVETCCTERERLVLTEGGVSPPAALDWIGNIGQYYIQQTNKYTEGV